MRFHQQSTRAMRDTGSYLGARIAAEWELVGLLLAMSLTLKVVFLAAVLFGGCATFSVVLGGGDASPLLLDLLPRQVGFIFSVLLLHSLSLIALRQRNKTVNPAARLPISTRKSLDTFYGLPYLTNPNFLSVSFAATRHASLGSARTPGR